MRGVASDRHLRGAFALALALRLFVAITAPLEPVWDGAIYERGAVALAGGHGYTRQVLDESNAAVPSAFYPVGYPATLSVLRRVGIGRRGDLVFQALVGSALVPATALLARRTGGRRAARIAAYVVALWPGGILLTAAWLAEPLVALTLVLALLPLAYTKRSRTGWSSALAGFVSGASAYLRMTSLAIVPLAVAFASVRRGPIRTRWTRVGANLALCVAASLVALAPWMVRNAASLGAPVLVSTNGGANLYLGTLRDGSYGPMPSDVECPTDLPEIERDACLTHAALRRVWANPIGWLARGVSKVAHTFGHESAPAQSLDAAWQAAGTPRPELALALLALERLAWVVLFGLAIGGASTREARSRVGRAVLLAPPLGLGLLHAVTLGGDRYHLAVVPSLAVLASIAMTRLVPSLTRP